MTKNRCHSKISQLPDSIRKEVENKILEGFTYEEIAQYLKKMGHNISLTSVHRYGKAYLSKFESVKMAKDFAKSLAEDNIDRPTTELHEANNALISQIIMDAIVKEELNADDKLKIARAIAALQKAQVDNEKIKIDARKEAGAVHVAMRKLKEQIFSEIGKEHPDIAEAIIKIADEVEKQTNM